MGDDAFLHKSAEQALLHFTRQPSVEAFLTGNSMCAIAKFVGALEEELFFMQTLLIPEVMTTFCVPENFLQHRSVLLFNVCLGLC